ncbi:uncharacterized protein LOC129301764 isoform X2 [Prosopis cineraria]|uniref:uncharacterized protein LOC129301764 isoform X2 n=1 Tax=Prosopis cineraria TaxID=364024 RepID=UPI00240F231D|nr:uncharacterized protein LOC129301764 isoform X2 [Prosopis cineraria]
MERFRTERRVQIQDSRSDPSKDGGVEDDDSSRGRYDNEIEQEENLRLSFSNGSVSEDQEPFMGIKVRRKASLHRDFKGDYIDVPSQPSLMKILQKQGDKQVLFADKVLKFTGLGKMKKLIIPTEYDLFMASTRKTEIVTVLVEATKSASDYQLDVVFSNRFEYNAASDIVKEIQFEEVEGGVKTRILRK